MNNKELQKTLAIAKSITFDTGNKLKEIYYQNEDLKATIKSKLQIVTKADKIANELIISQIKKHFPKHSILSEETNLEEQESDYMWIVDPLDGTTNFSVRFKFWNTTIALTYKEKIILGTVYAPMFDQMYWASKSNGAYLNGEQIKVTREIQPDKTFHGFCYGEKLSNAKTIAAKYYEKMINKGYPCRQVGSAALELAKVADGTFGSMYVPGANSWDIAAGALLIEEAGGVLLDREGEGWNIQSDSIVAVANKEIYQELNKQI
jgi:myo-inositol-1(or 4)-monophosphatase